MPTLDLAPTIKYILCGFTLGQILALCNTGTGVTSQLLTDKIEVGTPDCYILSATLSINKEHFLCEGATVHQI